MKAEEADEGKLEQEEDAESMISVVVSNPWTSVNARRKNLTGEKTSNIKKHRGICLLCRCSN